MSPIVPVPGGKVLLMGGSGTGKTYSLRTLPESVTGFALFTEPGMRTVSDIPCDRLHWRYVPAASIGFDQMLKNAQLINRNSFESLTKMKDGIAKDQHGQFMQMLAAMNDFTCDRCGQNFGSVTTWSTDRMLFIDSLSGLNIMAMDLIVGAKPVKAPGEWGVAMDTLERFINQVCFSLACHAVLVAHLDREVDEINGGTTLTAAALGKKLAPKIPRFFDDCVLAVRDKDKFSWSTTEPRVDLKARNLPLKSGLRPSWSDYVELWQKAGGEILATDVVASTAQ